MYSWETHADELPTDILKDCFQKKRAAVGLTRVQTPHGDLQQKHVGDQTLAPQRQSILPDESRVRMLEILLQRQKMTTAREWRYTEKNPYLKRQEGRTNRPATTRNAKGFRVRNPHAPGAVRKSEAKPTA